MASPDTKKPDLKFDSILSKVRLTSFVHAFHPGTIATSLTIRASTNDSGRAI
jgi:hypothetical protein